MKKRKRLVIPVLLGMIGIGLLPATGYAAENGGQSITLTLEVPEKPDARIEAPSDAKTLTEVTLPKDWTWKETDTPVQPGRTITVTAVHKDGYEVALEVTGKLAILSEGTDREYTIGIDSSASIHCNGVLDALVSVELDGNTVGPENYEKKDGSTILTFQKAYLDAQTVENHTVTLNYETGSIDSDLKIKKATAATEPMTETETDITETDTTETDKTGTGTTGTGTTGTGTTGTGTTGTGAGTSSAKTGDMSNVDGMAVLAVLSLGACIVLLIKKKRTM